MFRDKTWKSCRKLSGGDVEFTRAHGTHVENLVNYSRFTHILFGVHVNQ